MHSLHPLLLATLCLLFLTHCTSDRAPETAEAPEDSTPELLPTDRWTYIEIDSAKAMWGEFDEPEWLRYFGMAAGDLNGDGLLDLVSGRNVYYNPGGGMTGGWEKVDLGRNVDANLIYHYGNSVRDVDVSGENVVILAEHLPDVISFRADAGAEGFAESAEVVAQVPPTGHHNGQGYKIADVFGGNDVDEVIYASQGGLYVLDPSTDTPWSVTLVAQDASDEGFGVADMDGDGDQDLISGYRVPGADAEVPTVVVWWENPGEKRENWTRHDVGRTQFATDRVEAGDLDGDGRPEVVVSEERYPGEEPDASLFIYSPSDTGFVRTTLVTQYSMNNLALADMDGDGDLDILTAEHKGPNLSLQLWKNDGAASFTKEEIDTGKESHLGVQPYDMDGDGDLDIISIGWDKHQFVHLWRNDAVRAK